MWSIWESVSRCCVLFIVVSGWVRAMTGNEQGGGALEKFPPRVGRVWVDLDHFTFRRERMQLRALWTEELVGSKREKSPVFVYCGNEGAIEDFYNASGGIFEAAKTIGAYVFFIEHRYYGRSLPFGNQSFTNENLVYLSIEQSLADIAQVLAFLPDIIGCSGTHLHGLCDTILFGGSYGGMLAAWHRLKYPHLSLGAIASGAPVDFWPDSGIEKEFERAYLQTYELAAKGCRSRVREVLIAASLASPEQLAVGGVKSCNPQDESGDMVEQFLFYSKGALATLAMADYPYACDFIAPLPANPVLEACKTLGNAQDDSVEEAVARLVAVVSMLVNATGDLECLGLSSELVGFSTVNGLRRKLLDGGVLHFSTISWNYQACTELPLEPITSDGFGFYPPESATQLSQLVIRCRKLFDVETRPSWLPTSFGTGETLSDARRGLSNVLFIENSKVRSTTKTALDRLNANFSLLSEIRSPRTPGPLEPGVCQLSPAEGACNSPFFATSLKEEHTIRTCASPANSIPPGCVRLVDSPSTLFAVFSNIRS